MVLKKAKVDLQSGYNIIIEDIVLKLKQHPDLLEKCKQVIQSDDAPLGYARDLMGKQVSDAVGSHVDIGEFVDAMNHLGYINNGNVRELFRKGKLYRNKNTIEYYKHGFGKNIRANFG